MQSFNDRFLLRLCAAFCEKDLKHKAYLTAFSKLTGRRSLRITFEHFLFYRTLAQRGNPEVRLGTYANQRASRLEPKYSLSATRSTEASV